MECILESWKHRPLTLIGRVLVINTLCESLFVYKMSVMTNIPKDLLRRINDAVNNFLWGNRKARISRETLCQIQRLWRTKTVGCREKGASS